MLFFSNILSKLLNKAVSNGEIGYHPHCKEVNLSHFSFADDIVVFTNGSPESLRSTLDVFDKFARLSVLRINIANSTEFAAGKGKATLENAALWPLHICVANQESWFAPNYKDYV